MTSKLLEHTFKDSGRTVQLERVSPFLLRSATARYDRLHVPKVPVKVIEQTINGETDHVEIPNPNDPAYQLELSVWKDKQKVAHTLITNYLYALRGLKSEPDHEAVAQLLLDAPWLIEDTIAELEQHDVEFDPKVQDAYLYLWDICITTVAEATEFYNLMRERQVSKEEL